MAGFETDDLIKQYLKKDDTGKAASPVSVGKSIADDDLIKRYMKSQPEKEGAAPTGFNSATGKATYGPVGEASKAVGPKNELEKAVRGIGSDVINLPANAVKAGYNAAKSGILEAGEGLGEALSGKPASGIGKIGMGALSVAGAPLAPVASAVSDITGSESVGDKAALVAGFGLPVAPAARAISAARPTNKAFQSLVEMIEPQNAGKVAAEMRADPRLTPADLSPAVKSATQKLFTVEGDKPKNYIAGVVNQRASGANSAVNTAMDASLGSRVDPVAKLDELKTNIVNAGKQAIEPALAKTKPVDVTPIVKHIDSVLKPGVNELISNPENMLPYTRVQQTLGKWRDFITNDSVNLTDPNALHKLQSGIRRQADDLLKSSDPEARATGYALYGLRNKFIEAIGNAGPQTVDKAGKPVSEYRAGLSRYRDENDVADAFRHGHDAIIKNGRALEDNPEFFKQWVKEATPEEIEAAKQGANIAIRTAMNAYRAPVTNTTSKAQQMAQVDFNRQRIETLFGKEQADKIFTRLENERKIAETNNDLIHGSQTAMRSAADKHVELPVKGESNGIGQYVIPALGTAAEIGGSMAGLPTGLGGAIGLTASLGSMAVKKAASATNFAVKTALAKEKNAQLAKYALPTEGPDREALIRQLEAVAAEHSRPRLSVMNKGRLAASAAGLPVSP